jgi:hypothetical protein
MKKLIPLLIGFSPLVAFSLLTKILPSGDVGVAGLVAALLALVAMLISRPIWPPKILTACSLVIFTVIAVLGFSLDKGDKLWLATWPGGGVAIILGAIILLLVPAVPFTEQYAKESVPKEEWGSPTFKRVNHRLSLAWGASIVVIGVARVLAEAVARHSSGHHLAQILLGAAVPVIVILYMLKFTQSYPERVTHAPAA